MQGDNREPGLGAEVTSHRVYAEKILVAAQIQFKFHDNASMLKKCAASAPLLLLPCNAG